VDWFNRQTPQVRMWIIGATSFVLGAWIF